MSSEPASWDVVGAMINKCLVTCPSSAGTVSPSVLGSALSHVVEGLGDEGGMHLTLEYPPPETCAPLLEDVASLIIHHVKRQSNTSKEDKRTMKFLVSLLNPNTACLMLSSLFNVCAVFRFAHETQALLFS